MNRLTKALKHSWPELTIEAGIIGIIISLCFIPSGYHADLLWVPITAAFVSFALFCLGGSRRQFLHNMLPIVRPISGAFAAIFWLYDIELIDKIQSGCALGASAFLEILIFGPMLLLCGAFFMASVAIGLIAIQRSLKKYA